MRYDKSSVAGVVVLYDPDDTVVENIRTYIDQVDCLYAVDNSETANSSVVEGIKKLGSVRYVWNGKNLGIASALTIGAGFALEKKYEFLFTVDQDSKAAPGLIGEFFKCLEMTDSNAIGILAPYHDYENFKRRRGTGKYEEVVATVTSGNLLNLKAYEEVGPFLEELFIDYVDFEYCLRLKARGFTILQVNSAVLHHALGSLVSRRFIFRTVAVTNHPPVRIYYRTRNRLFVSRKYYRRFPLWAMKDLIIFGNELIKILFFEKQKARKFSMVIRGIQDFLAGRFGKYSE